MAQLTATRILNAIKGLFVSLDSTDDALLKKMLWRRQVRCPVTDGGTAGTAQGEVAFWYNDTGVDVKVVNAYAVTPVGVTANATTYATFELTKRVAGAATSIGTFATDTVTTDDMTAYVEKSLTLTDANVLVPAGAWLAAKVTKASTGVAIASSTAQASIVAIIEPNAG